MKFELVHSVLTVKRDNILDGYNLYRKYQEQLPAYVKELIPEWALAEPIDLVTTVNKIRGIQAIVDRYRFLPNLELKIVYFKATQENGDDASINMMQFPQIEYHSIDADHYTIMKHKDLKYSVSDMVDVENSTLLS